MGIAQHIIHWNCNHIFTAYIYIYIYNPKSPMDGLGWVHIPENDPSMASLNAPISPSFRNWGNAPKEPQHRQEAVDSSHGSLRLMARRWPRHPSTCSSEISRSHRQGVRQQREGTDQQGDLCYVLFCTGWLVNRGVHPPLESMTNLF